MTAFKFYILFLTCFFITFNLQSQDIPKQNNNKATIYFIRPKIDKVLLNVNLYHQSDYIGQLKAMSCLKYECSPGHQLFWGTTENHYFIELNVENGGTYIIKAELVAGMLKKNIRLTLINKMDEQYEKLLSIIIKKKPHFESVNQIAKTNAHQRIIIDKSLSDYRNQSIGANSGSQQPIINQDLICTKSIIEIRKAPITLDYNFLDFPFSKKSVESGGVGGLFSDPSMSQSLNITSSFYSTTREGLSRLLSLSEKTRKRYKLAFVTTDFMTYAFMPLTAGWLHEEFHRAVFTKYGGSSYNDMNNFPFFKSLVNVSHVKDDDLISLKKNHPVDMIRMSEVGIEGEYRLSNYINKTAFFNNSKSQTLIPLLITLNSSQYVQACTTKDADNMTNTSNKDEGANVNVRDLVGLDFLAWVYDLHRPNEPYESRGIHPSGVGINRYIKRSQLTHNELSYLKQQGYLQLINFLNPMLFFKNSFTIHEKENGDDTRANLYFNHWLSPFGYDISTVGLLHYNRHNYAFTLHNYNNYNKWFPGIELETYNYLLGEGKLKHPIRVSARVMLWLQPKDQLFVAKHGSFGGFVETKIYYPINKYLQPYLLISAKTDGWVQGNVYLEKNISGEFGFRAYF